MAPPPPPISSAQASPSPMLPSSASTIPLVNLILRVLTFVFLFASLIVITTNTATDYTSDTKFKFNYFYAYRYMLFAIVVGIVYTLLQTAFAIYQVTMGKRISHGLYKFDFYGDKVMSYILGTGAAATFGASVDLNRLLYWNNSNIPQFLDKANAAASLLLIGFVFSAVSSIFSSLMLPTKDY